MKYIFVLLCIFLNFSNLPAQQCQNDSVGLIPICELGTGFFSGMQGGLYGNGQNSMPTTHKQHGIVLANNIEPLNNLGNPDPSGKIGFISMGMSNCNMFFGAFRDSAVAYPYLNPKLSIVNAATGGYDIDAMLNPSSGYWTTVDQKMAMAGLSNNQVQVIWFEQAKHINGIPVGQGVEHIDTLERKFLSAFQMLRYRYPNLKQLFCSGRDYGGYSNPGQGNPEPYAYYTNWSFRKLVERQMAGDTALVYYGAGKRSPWLAWAGHIWADGKNTRSDGFNWICPDDLQPDGVHPSAIGQAKVASMLLDFFKTDSTTTWFRINPSTQIPSFTQTIFFIYPNPNDGRFIIELYEESNITVINSLGATVHRASYAAGSHSLDLSYLPSGVYLIKSESKDNVNVLRVIISPK